MLSEIGDDAHPLTNESKAYLHRISKGEMAGRLNAETQVKARQYRQFLEAKVTEVRKARQSADMIKAQQMDELAAASVQPDSPMPSGKRFSQSVADQDSPNPQVAREAFEEVVERVDDYAEAVGSAAILRNQALGDPHGKNLEKAQEWGKAELQKPSPPRGNDQQEAAFHYLLSDEDIAASRAARTPAASSSGRPAPEAAYPRPRGIERAGEYGSAVIAAGMRGPALMGDILIGRQGWPFLLTQPLQAGRLIGEIVRTAFRTTPTDPRFVAQFNRRLDRALAEMVTDEDNLRLARDWGFDLSAPGGVVQEEPFRFTHALMRGPLKSIENFNYLFLNRARIDAAKSWEKFMTAGGRTPTRAQRWMAGKAINTMTGRGGLYGLEDSPGMRQFFDLLTVFTAPRWSLSFFNRLTDPVVALPIAAEGLLHKGSRLNSLYMMGRVLETSLAPAAFMYGSMKLLEMAGLEVEWRPNSTNFGKVRVGDTWYDLGQRMQTPLRMIAQIHTGERITTKGHKIPARGKDVVFEYLDNRLTPLASQIIHSAIPRQFERQAPFDIPGLPGWVEDSLIPILVRDVIESFRKDGPFGAALTFSVGFFGGTVSTMRDSPRDIYNEKVLNDTDLLQYVDDAFLKPQYRSNSPGGRPSRITSDMLINKFDVSMLTPNGKAKAEAKYGEVPLSTHIKSKERALEAKRIGEKYYRIQHEEIDRLLNNGDTGKEWKEKTKVNKGKAAGEYAQLYQEARGTFTEKEQTLLDRYFAFVESTRRDLKGVPNPSADPDWDEVEKWKATLNVYERETLEASLRTFQEDDTPLQKVYYTAQAAARKIFDARDEYWKVWAVTAGIDPVKYPTYNEWIEARHAAYRASTGTSLLGPDGKVDVDELAKVDELVKAVKKTFPDAHEANVADLIRGLSEEERNALNTMGTEYGTGAAYVPISNKQREFLKTGDPAAMAKEQSDYTVRVNYNNAATSAGFPTDKRTDKTPGWLNWLAGPGREIAYEAFSNGQYNPDSEAERQALFGHPKRALSEDEIRIYYNIYGASNLTNEERRKIGLPPRPK
jgi:hypothetical protein